MNAKNPKHTSDQTIDLDIEHPEFGWIPFTASPNDVEEKGRDLYAQAIAGDFGPVAAYVPPPPHISTSVENKTEAERRLAETDWVNEPDVHDTANTPHLTNRNAFLTYRSAIRGVAVSPTDGNLDWPTEPTAVWSV
jgi:hypothetical protein